MGEVVRAVHELCATTNGRHPLRIVLDSPAPSNVRCATDLAVLGFAAEHTYWECYDSGRLWRSNEWLAAWGAFLAPGMGCSTPMEATDLWRKAQRSFLKLKRRMPVVFAMIERNDRLLMVHSADRRHVVSLPGGKCFTAWGESLEDCLVREIEEEVCVRVSPGDAQLLRCVHNKKRSYHVFRVQLPKGAEPRPDGKEIVRVEWALPEAACRPASGDVVRSLLDCDAQNVPGLLRAEGCPAVAVTAKGPKAPPHSLNPG